MSVYQVQDAQSRNMERLLRAWDAEIEAAAEHLRKEAVRIANEQAARALEQSKAQAQEAADAALTHSISSYLEGLAVQAQSNDASAVSIPSGVRVASTSFAGPALTEISALVSEAEREIGEGRFDSATESSQRSATWALEHGLMPHPGDLGRLVAASGVDASWGERFSQLGAKLDNIDAGASVRHGQMKAYLAHEKLGALQDYVNVLGAFGGGRVVGLVSNPASLGGIGALSGTPPTSSQSGGARGKMPEREFNKMLDNLFGR